MKSFVLRAAGNTLVYFSGRGAITLVEEAWVTTTTSRSSPVNSREGFCISEIPVP
jgi:hypothetical protein